MYLRPLTRAIHHVAKAMTTLFAWKSVHPHLHCIQLRHQIDQAFPIILAYVEKKQEGLGTRLYVLQDGTRMCNVYNVVLDLE